nr:ABC transporter permease [Mesorhizobium sp. WSM4875]
MHLIVVAIMKRVALGLFTLLIVSVVIFSSIATLPGDFAKAILGRHATPETVAALQKEVGLDKPPVVRYVNWIAGVVRGDFGSSFASGVGNRRTVAELIAPRLYNTFFLALLTASIAVPLSLVLGVLAATYRNGWFDRIVNATTLLTISFPEFFVAYILILILAVNFPMFSSLSSVGENTTFLDQVTLCALPATTLTLGIVAHMMRMTRSAIVNVLASPYIEMAQLKGVPRWHVIVHHALPNAWAPIANVVALNLAYLVVGVVVVEVVFVYPGIGQLMVDSVTSRDIPVVQACTLIFATTYVVLNLMADVVATVTNPRLLHPK